jgi:hypothetical protein
VDAPALEVGVSIMPYSAIRSGSPEALIVTP